MKSILSFYLIYLSLFSGLKWHLFYQNWSWHQILQLILTVFFIIFWIFSSTSKKAHICKVLPLMWCTTNKQQTNAILPQAISVASGGAGGKVPPDDKKFAKNREKEGKHWEKREKSGKKRTIWTEMAKIGKVLSLCPSWQRELATPLPSGYTILSPYLWYKIISANNALSSSSGGKHAKSLGDIAETLPFNPSSFALITSLLPRSPANGFILGHRKSTLLSKHELILHL